MPKRIVITGMGCISPVGNNVETTWKNILAGKSGAGPITLFEPTEEFTSKIAGEVKDFDPVAIFGRKEARRMDRFTQFAVVSTMEALEHANLEITEDNRDRIGALIGSGIGGINTLQEQLDTYYERGASRVSPFLVPMMIPDAAGAMVAIRLGVRGPNFAISTACATGTNTIGEAAEVIRRGQADVMLAGGSEAAIIPIAVAGLCTMTALTTRNDDPEHASRPFDKDRDGFLIAEGAAVLVLESLEHAQARGANILAEVIGYGSNNDAYHLSAPSENGYGAMMCMKMAMESAQLDVTDIDYINAHGTSTALNDHNETLAIKSIFGEQAYNIPISSTKSMTGHLMGATGALEAIFCVNAIRDNIVPPTINYTTPDPECDLDYVPNQAREHEVNITLSNSFGFGGHNASIILSRYQPLAN